MLCLNTVSRAIRCVCNNSFKTLFVKGRLCNNCNEVFLYLFFFQLEFKVEKLVTDKYVAVKYLPHVLAIGLTIFRNCFTNYKIVGFCDFFIQEILFYAVKHNSLDFILYILYFM